MEQNLEITVALLRRTPAALNALLRDLPETWIFRNEGENSWNVFEIIGHLVYSDRTAWVPRAKFFLTFGETKSFEPFDREGQRREMEGKTLGQLLDEFSRVRAQSLSDLESLQLSPEHLMRRGQHPSFGAVSLSQLLATWAAHDLNHLHQITRVMAHQYREAVGPWTQFLGVMKCDGHSSPA